MSRLSPSVAFLTGALGGFTASQASHLELSSLRMQPNSGALVENQRKILDYSYDGVTQLLKTALAAAGGGISAGLTSWYLRRRADTAMRRGEHRKNGIISENTYALYAQPDGRICVRTCAGPEQPLPKLFREDALPSHQQGLSRAVVRGNNLPIFFRFSSEGPLEPVGLMRFDPHDEKHVAQALVRRELNTSQSSMARAVQIQRSGQDVYKLENVVYVALRRDQHTDQPTTWMTKFPAAAVHMIAREISSSTFVWNEVQLPNGQKGFEMECRGSLHDLVTRMYTNPDYRRIVITDLLQIALTVKYGGEFNQHGICAPDRSIHPNLGLVFQTEVDATSSSSPFDIQSSDELAQALVDLSKGSGVAPDTRTKLWELAAAIQLRKDKVMIDGVDRAIQDSLFRAPT